MELNTRQKEVLRRMEKVETLFPSSWLSFWPKYKGGSVGTVGGSLTATMRKLDALGYVELNHFIGYKLTKLGRDVARNTKDSF